MDWLFLLISPFYKIVTARSVYDAGRVIKPENDIICNSVIASEADGSEAAAQSPAVYKRDCFFAKPPRNDRQCYEQEALRRSNPFWHCGRLRACYAGNASLAVTKNVFDFHSGALPLDKFTFQADPFYR